MRMSKGFTLIEIIIYLVILIFFSLILGDSIFTMSTSFGKARVKRNLMQEGNAAIERMVRELRLAEGIDPSGSLLNIVLGQLTLDTVVSPSDDTPITRTFFLQGGDLMIQEGTNSPVALTSDIAITRLTFRVGNRLANVNGTRALFVRGLFAGCSDSAAGTSPASAFCTISKAASIALPGDIIYVGAGMYEETVTPANSGTATDRISYIADLYGDYTGDAGPVVLDGYVDGGSGDRCYAFDTSPGRSYLVIDGFEATRYRTCIADNATIHVVGNNNILRNLIVHNTREHGIRIEGSNNLLENCLVYKIGHHAIEFSNSNNVVRNCTFTDPSIDIPESARHILQQLESGNGTNIFENNIFGYIRLGHSGSWQNQIWNNNDWTGGTLPPFGGSGSGNISADPLLIDPASGNHRLSHVEAGQSSNSPAIDAGFQEASAWGADIFTTRTDDVPDASTVDMGYHYPLPAFRSTLIFIELTAEIGSGILHTSETFSGSAVLRGSY